MLTLGVNDLLVFNNGGIKSSESRSLSESLQFDYIIIVKQITQKAFFFFDILIQ